MYVEHLVKEVHKLHLKVYRVFNMGQSEAVEVFLTTERVRVQTFQEEEVFLHGRFLLCMLES